MNNNDDNIKRQKYIQQLTEGLLKNSPHLAEQIIKTPNDVKKQFEDYSKGFHQKIQEESIEIVIESIKDVQEKHIQWLWHNVIAYGKMTLFAGEPGVGKSQLLLYIASILSNGDKFHFSFSHSEKANVLLISGEDNADDTLKPRLMALGANLEKIHNVKGIQKTDKNGNLYFDPICLVENIAEIEQKIIENKYKLIIVDPISVYLGSIDENKNKEIRSALNCLMSLAERHNVALVLNSHFSKPNGTSSKNAIYRVMGSIGFAAAARIVYGIIKDPDDPARRLFVPIKNNIGKDEVGYVYKIVQETVGDKKIATSRIEWLNETVTKTANEILNPPVEIKSPKLEQAKEFLKNLLKNGPRHLTEIRRTAEEMDISIGRLYEAKNVLKILEDEYYMGKKCKIWTLPLCT